MTIYNISIDEKLMEMGPIELVAHISAAKTTLPPEYLATLNELDLQIKKIKSMNNK